MGILPSVSRTGASAVIGFLKPGSSVNSHPAGGPRHGTPSSHIIEPSARSRAILNQCKCGTSMACSKERVSSRTRICSIVFIRRMACTWWGNILSLSLRMMGEGNSTTAGLTAEEAARSAGESCSAIRLSTSLGKRSSFERREGCTRRATDRLVTSRLRLRAVAERVCFS